MSQLNDCRHTALVGMFGTGHTNDLLIQWLQANGATSNSISDAWMEMLIGQGAVVPFHRNDAWFDLLGDLGYEGSLNDRELEFWCAGGSIAPQATLYVNPEFLGDPIPTAHERSFSGGTSTLTSRPNGFREWEFTTATNARDVGSYNIDLNNPGLEVGATYKLSYMCRKNILGTYGAALSQANLSDITIIDSDTAISDTSGDKELYVMFTIDAPNYYGTIRFGSGTTTGRIDSLTYWEPKLVLISSSPLPANTLTTDSGEALTNDNGTLILVTDPILEGAVMNVGTDGSRVGNDIDVSITILARG